MKFAESKQTITAIAVVIFGFVGVFGLSGIAERSRPPLPAGFEDEDLSVQGARLKGFALGFEGLLADWYWMRSLQYIGAKIIKDREANDKFNLEDMSGLNPRLLYPLLDNAATLDSHFTAVYSYGAVILPAIDPGQAVKLLEKGINENPNEWRLYEQLGYIYWRLGDYERAAETYEAGAKISGAPPFMTMMRSKMQSAGGDRQTARAVYERMLGEATNEQVKENAALHLLELDSKDERDAINSSLQNFRRHNNRCANGWRELLPMLQTVKLSGGKSLRVDAANNLTDPSGAPYILDQNACEAILDPAKTKLPFK